MAAPAEKSRGNFFTRPLVVRLVSVWLAFVLVLGLWQGYGAWLSRNYHAG